MRSAKFENNPGMKTLSRAFRKQIREVKLGLAAVVQKPSVGAVHRLRVSARKLKSTLWALKKGSNQEIPRSVRAPLDRLLRTLGRERELDVLIRDALHYGIDPEKLGTERRAATKNLARLAESKTIRVWIKRLKKFAEKTHEREAVRLSSVHAALCEKLAVSLEASPKTPRQLHRLRMDFKKARYILEAQNRRVPALKTIQKTLGRYHDLQVLQKRFGRHPEVSAEADRLLAKARRCMRPSVQEVLG